MVIMTITIIAMVNLPPVALALIVVLRLCR
ncbi:hypothetical protein HK44_004920 [Pseudomonas fluorescens HK44]|uniref:Uncharacterized protein n=1 Tax=Pseudomonas fluorescens HK44 TaxID=1042209 RepID=A0A010RNK7_PSEFL|nr:hypothetical protein HK44_004920 [Pseudomonas fluorescens HK44]